MHQVPSLHLLNKDDFVLYQAFINDCLKYSITSNTRRSSAPLKADASSFYEWLGSESITYICHRDNRNIGIIVIDFYDNNVGVSFYTHPKVCKMSAISLGRASALLAYKHATLAGCTEIFTSTIHTLVLTVFQKYFKTNYLKVGPFFVASSVISERSLELFKVDFEQEDLKIYLETYE